MAIDFFIVPTFSFKILFVFLVLAHRRREVLHFNVTEHPTAEWIAQQLVEAVADRDAPRYLIHDRDRVYGRAVNEKLASLNVQQIITAPGSPWQNGIVERADWIDSTRMPRSCDRVQSMAPEADP